MSDYVHALTGILFGAAVVGVGAWIIFGIDRFYDRRARRVAPSGFTYTSLDTEGIGSIEFQLFRYEPDLLQVERVLAGTNQNLPARLFLYRGVRQQLATYSARTIQFRCATVRTGSEFPAFVLARKDAQMPASPAAPPRVPTGASDIDAAFDVYCADPQFVAFLTQPETMQWLLAIKDVAYVELLGPYVLVADRSVKIDRTWPQLLDGLDAFVAHVPTPNSAAPNTATPNDATNTPRTAPLAFITADTSAVSTGTTRRSRSMTRSYLSLIAAVTVSATIIGVVRYGILDRGSSSPSVSVSVNVPTIFPSKTSCPTGRPSVTVTKVAASVDAVFDTPTDRTWNVHVEGTVTNRSSAAISLALVAVTVHSTPPDSAMGTTKAVKLDPGQTTTWKAEDELVSSPSRPTAATATLFEWSWESFDATNCATGG